MKSITRFLLSIFGLLLSIAGATNAADDSTTAKALFKNPSRDFSTGPLWVWNDLLTEHQIRETLQDLARQKVKQVWVHPRPGLMTPYLSEDWFRLWKVSLEEARRLDMNVWIYDENSYPSGFAGGFVPRAMPESRGRGLTFRSEKSAPKWSENLVGVYRLAGTNFDNVTASVKASENLPDGEYLVATEVRDQNNGWHAGGPYVNLLSPGVTEKFLEITLEPYRKNFAGEFGKRIPGVFTDEPNVRPVGDFPWSEFLLAEFKKRWGYDLLDHLASLSKPVGDWRRVRHNYFQVVHEQFVEHWARPYHDYCATNHLEWTGHYWDHEWPNCVGVPDNMAMYAWHQRPAIDCLMNQYAEHTHGQFGNIRMVRELSSVANQLGDKRTLCEIYGAGGWDLRFEDMKRIGDWLQVLGVNTLNEHLSYVTIRGARKRDHPQSFSYHEPWWDAYHLNATYFTRLSAALTRGQQINRVLVLEPTTTAWMYQGDGARLNQIGDSFFKLLMALEAAQIEYDIGDEDIIARYGSPGSRTINVANRGVIPHGIRIGQREYDTLIIPPFNENLNRTTKALLDKVAIGQFVPGAMFTYLDGTAQAKPHSFDWISENLQPWLDNFVSDLKAAQKESGFAIERTPKDPGILFHHRRQLEDGDLLFLVNTSAAQRSSGVIFTKLQSAEQWNLNTGEISPYPIVADPRGSAVKFELPPSGSLLLFLSKKPSAFLPLPEMATRIEPAGDMSIRRVQPNVLTLDYVDISAGDTTRTNVYFYEANQLAWRKNGMDRNPWDSAVQFKDELIRKIFPTNSGFVASYRFKIQDQIPANLAIVIERPDLYTITCNGTSIKARKGDWWLDKAFGRMPIAKQARLGENAVTIKASPFTIYHELESAYLLGDFSLTPANSGFVVSADHPIELGSIAAGLEHGINPDGTMWLSAGIGFENYPPDNAPFVIFDLGADVDLSAVKIWNYNENHVRDLTSRGAREIRITGATSAKPDDFNLALGDHTLRKANGQPSGAQTLELKATKVRLIKVEVLSNHRGVRYPVEGEPADNGFVGLAEVQFLNRSAGKISNVKIARCSSQLTSRERPASHLVDGSGLESGKRGWNAQGHPFYAAGVGYRQNFFLAKPTGRYVVSLAGWQGSVAEVKVNGKRAGWISAPPFECDVSSHLRKGNNAVEVVVIGTLKNTLGPHHGNPVVGSAWPGNFQQGPASAPPGDRYHTLAYGLFEPFNLRQFLPKPSLSSAIGTGGK